MKTPTRSEGSVTFSLGELMKLEDERIAEVAREREARERATVEARLDAERRERTEAEAKARAEAEAEERRRRAELDEIARREAMQRAAVEQARLEVEARTRADERERERRHEMELQTRRAVEAKPASLGGLIGATGLGGGLMLLVACVIHFGVTQPATERRLAELELRNGTAEQHAIDAERKIDDQRRQLAALEKNKAALEAELESLRNAPATVKTTKTGPGPVAHPPAPTTKSTDKSGDCDPLDPMCFKIRPVK